MPNILEGTLDGSGLNIGIVIARFNQFISQSLLDGALECLVSHGVADEAIEVIWVPGSFELPLVARQMARSDKFKAIVALGAVIRGETPHFEYVATEAANGIARATYETGIPIIFGVLTTNNMDQAIERSLNKGSNKGSDAALAAIEMANLMRLIDGGGTVSGSVRNRAGFR